MNTLSLKAAALSLPALALASCANAESGESAPAAALATQFVTDIAAEPAADAGLTVTEMGEFARPWAIEFMPGTSLLFVTEKEGALKIMDTETGSSWDVAGIPDVAYGGQGGFGDIVFLDSEAGNDGVSGRTVYLSWAEMGEGDARGAVVGKATLQCPEMTSCALEGLEVIWRQAPKVEGRGHYSHRISVSPDEQYLYVASGDRQKLEPAQDLSNTMGTIVRLNMDGTPADGNPFADQGGVTAEIWSYGHRNILGMDFDAQGRLWDVEHGPGGGDELNLVAREANYGWPTRSYGNHYNGDPITDHSEDDGFAKPAVTWTPVIAPGDMIFYSGDMFGDWQGHALIAGLRSEALVHVELDGVNAREVGRYQIGGRLRSIAQGPDGSIWVAEDGEEARILKVTAE